MQIFEKELSEIKPYENNPRNNDNAVSAVVASICEFGFKVPIVIDSDGVIVCGHTRYKAAQEIGLKTVPCVIADDLTPEQIKAFRLADNKTGELATWDFEKLELETAELETIELEKFGFDDDILDKEKSETTKAETTEDDYEKEPPKEPKSKLGDLYQLGNHRLICGDSTDVVVIDRLMDGVKADCVLSDPPYGMNLDTDFSTIKGSMKSLGRKNHVEGNKYEKVIGDNEDFKPELITTFFANFDYVKEMFLFGADYFAEILPDKNKGSWLVWDKRKESQADAIGSEFELIWSRNKHKRRMLRHDWFGFSSSENGADARNRVHPTQKPITLLVDILNQWGKDANIVVDLYGGSGSTLIACEQLNRKCYMCELDPHYVDVIIDRWEKFTGQKARKIND
jgi:site-specific DNA-methyltransferase (adenine-specific)